MNIAIFLTTRIGSSRLSNKALLEINNKTVTDILIERLKHAKLPIIMTTPNTVDDVKLLKPIADSHGIQFFHGDNSPIKRHKAAANWYNVDYIINIDGDDILTLPEVISSVYYHAQQKKFLLPVKTTGLPLGLNVIGYSSSVLDGIQSTDTGWGAKIFSGRYHEVKFNYDIDARLTLDYEDDFNVIKDILTNCKRNLQLGGICSYIKSHPCMLRNLYLNKEYWERMNKLS